MANVKKKLCVKPEWCKGCGICVAFCPKQTLKLVKQKITIADPDSCIACGMCEMRCPDYAIWLEKEAE
ncbi:MAG: 4Fe-4S dicluster domain-containing protein [Ruminococcaceae bacterium]|nr:4Fe-4S dicluster domain-containing protein [Oscillospiraceae bacterium]